jgi:Trk K+ transport system NAD-binding subunit
VIEPDGTQRINPEPDQIIQQGATLVVIGRREHMQALKQLIGGEER